MSRRTWCAGLAPVSMLLLVTPIRGQDLTARMSAVLDAREYHHGRWGLLVVEAETGKPVFERNADQLFIPASTTKLYTCAAALQNLGPDYRFETPVYSRGVVEDGRLHGDLILVASGDLTFGGRTLPDGRLAFTNDDHTYANATSTTAWLTPTDPLAGLTALAKQVKAAGINQIDGDVLIDARLFDPAEASGSGPRLISPIVVNDNVIDVIVTPAPAAGQPATVTVRPETSFVIVDAEVRSKADGRPDINVSSTARESSLFGEPCRFRRGRSSGLSRPVNPRRSREHYSSKSSGARESR